MYVYVVSWSEFPIVPSYPHYPQIPGREEELERELSEKPLTPTPEPLPLERVFFIDNLLV